MIRVFMGGTCNETTWRSYLEEQLKDNENISLFNPIVKDWNEEAQKRELEERENCDYCLYVITPKMTGVYSIAEVTDDSNKRPEKTLFCYLDKDEDYMFDYGQLKSLENVRKMIERNGAKTFLSLDEIINFLADVSKQ